MENLNKSFMIRNGNVIGLPSANPQIDDSQIGEKAWSSQKTSDEIAEVETALPNIKKFASPSGTARYITISGTTLGDIEVHSAYAGKYMFTSTGAKPIFFGTSTYLGYTLTGWAWNSDKTKLYLRVSGQRDFVISAFGSDGVEISDMTTTEPTDVTFNTTFNYNAYIDNSTSENTSTYSSAKIDTELTKKPTKYSKTYSGTHGRYIKIGSLPVSSGVVSKATILMSLFSSSDQIEAYPVGFLTINISSGSNNNRFNINGTTTIPLNNSTNLTTPRIVVEKTSTYYNLYVDCKYNYMWIDYMLLQTDTHYVNGNFEALDALEGTEYWSSVTSDDIKYVGDLAKLDDSSTGSTVSTWSSSKTKSYIDTIRPTEYTFVDVGESVDTGWSIKNVTNGDMCRILIVNVYNSGKSGTCIYSITANYGDSTDLNSKLISNTITGNLSILVSSNGTIVIKNAGTGDNKLWFKLITP